MDFSGIKAGIEKIKTSLPGPVSSLFAWCYAKLTLVGTSIWILGVMGLFYMVGTIFPQGEKLDDYIKADGRFLLPVKLFGLLDFFSSPVFMLASILLLLNLAVCTLRRYPSLFAPKKYPQEFTPSRTICLTHDMSDAQIETRRVLREELGFKVKDSESAWAVMEKGIPYRALTLLYHAGIIVCFAGFFLTFLFAYEGNITLKPNEPQTVTPEESGRLMGLLGIKPGSSDFSLLLDRFISEYVEAPALDYPDEAASRLAIGLGWNSPKYSIKDDSLSPRAWKSRIRVQKAGKNIVYRTIEVNGPLRYGGYTFYQEGFEQKIKIRVDGNPIALEAKEDEDMTVPGIDSPLKFSTARLGPVTRLDGKVEDLKPYTTVKKRLSGKKGKEYQYVGKLSLSEPLEIDGARISFAGLKESSVLSYRYDPGTGLLWWGGIFVLITMALRFYGGWYRVAYRLRESDGIVSLELDIETKGLGADAERITKRLERLLTRADLKPAPLPHLS